jgi:hypothetical protein
MKQPVKVRAQFAPQAAPYLPWLRLGFFCMASTPLMAVAIGRLPLNIVPQGAGPGSAIAASTSAPKHPHSGPTQGAGPAIAAGAVNYHPGKPVNPMPGDGDSPNKVPVVLPPPAPPAQAAPAALPTATVATVPAPAPSATIVPAPVLPTPPAPAAASPGLPMDPLPPLPVPTSAPAPVVAAPTPKPVVAPAPAPTPPAPRSNTALAAAPSPAAALASLGNSSSRNAEDPVSLGSVQTALPPLRVGKYSERAAQRLPEAPASLQPQAACTPLATQAHASRANTTLVDLTGDGLIVTALPTGQVQGALQRAGYRQVALNSPASWCLPPALVTQLMRPPSFIAQTGSFKMVKVNNQWQLVDSSAPAPQASTATLKPKRVQGAVALKALGRAG